MGSNSSSGGGGGGNRSSANNVPPSRRKYDVSGTLADPREKDDTAAKMSLFREQGATNIKNTPMFGTGAILKPAFQAGSRKTRDYFVGEVLGKGAYKGTSRQEFERMSRSAQESMYKTYITGRTSGKTDAYGRTITQSDNGGAITSSGQVVQAPKVEVAPTTAEVSQATTTAATEDDIILRKRRAKAKGRSPTIMTGVTGVASTTGGLTLGKKSLLGIS